MQTLTASHKQLRHHVTEQLRAAILNGDFKPGEWLRQERLARDLGVSQMPVREALKELAAEGLVEHAPYRGVRVVEFSAQDVADLYAHRSHLEGCAAAAAAAYITADELAQLESLQAQMAAVMNPGRLAEYRELNRRFHQIIFQASRRPYLTRTLTQMWATFPTMLLGNFATTAASPLPERDDTDLREHQAILAALRAGDAEAARQSMQTHIQTSGGQLVAALLRGA